MENTSLFYKYYDTIFFEKNYRKETEFLIKKSSEILGANPKKILEIGCGTGNHTLNLASKNIPITAIDIDAEMISIAIEKIQNAGFDFVKIINSPIEILEDSEFDVAIAMFNVITYIPDTKNLISFFKAVHHRINAKAIFIFDCWNGIAALKDPPGNKKTEVQVGNELVSCIVTSETDFWKQKTKLTYQLQVKNFTDLTVQNGTFSFNQTLWTPMQIEYCLNEAGFEIFSSNKLLEDKANANCEDWKIMYICQK